VPEGLGGATVVLRNWPAFAAGLLKLIFPGGFLVSSPVYRFSCLWERRLRRELVPSCGLTHVTQVYGPCSATFQPSPVFASWYGNDPGPPMFFDFVSL